MEGDRGTGPFAKRLLQRLASSAESRGGAARRARSASRTPKHLRIDTYFGHGNGGRAVVRGRVLNNAEPASAVEGEGTRAALRRNLARFMTDELPDVPLRVRLGSVEHQVRTDAEGYFEARLDVDSVFSAGSWVPGEVELAATYRGIAEPCTTPLRVRVPSPDAAFGVISDVDDTIVHTGAQRVLEMVRRTMTGSAFTRTPFLGAAELYRALARHGAMVENPVFYVSSSPWNLYDFLVAFLDHRGFPLGPLLLRDLLGSGRDRSHASHKQERIAEVLEMHPGLRFVLMGDTGQHDATIYAEVVRQHPGRVLAVYLREVRLNPGDRRIEAVTDNWAGGVPFVLAADSAAVARHATDLGLMPPEARDLVVRVTAAQQ